MSEEHNHHDPRVTDEEQLILDELWKIRETTAMIDENLKQSLQLVTSTPLDASIRQSLLDVQSLLAKISANDEIASG